MQQHDASIRPGLPEDHAFIMSSWLQSYRDSSEFAKEIPKHVYFKYHHHVLETLLNRPSTQVIIATPKDDPDLIIGYLICEEVGDLRMFHYVYTKRPFSKMGICNLLIEGAPFPMDSRVLATHMTYKGRRIIDRLGLTYCPYAI